MAASSSTVSLLLPSLSTDLVGSGESVLMPEEERRAYFDILLRDCSACSRALSHSTAEERAAAEAAMERSVGRLRRALTLHTIPLPSENDLLFSDLCSQRGRIWKTLLGIGSNVAVHEYLHFLDSGPLRGSIPQITKDYDRITKESAFIRHRAISERPCQRVFLASLNWYLHRHPDRLGAYLNRHGAVEIAQGPLRLLIQFLKVMPELDAFFCFREYYALLEPLFSISTDPADPRSFPGLIALTRISELVLVEYLRLTGTTATPADAFSMTPQKKLEGFAFGLYSSGHTYQEKDEENDILVLWDSLIAYGYHLNFYLILARLLISYRHTGIEALTGVQHKHPKLQDPHQLLKAAFALLSTTPRHVLAKVFQYTYTRQLF